MGQEAVVFPWNEETSIESLGRDPGSSGAANGAGTAFLSVSDSRLRSWPEIRLDVPQLSH